MILPIIVLFIGGGLLLTSLYKNGRRVAHLAMLTILVGAVMTVSGNPFGLLVAACGIFGYRRLKYAKTVVHAKRAAKTMSTIGLGLAMLGLGYGGLPSFGNVGSQASGESTPSVAPEMQTIQAVDQRTGYPIITGGTPTNPLSPSASNADNRTVAVRAGDRTRTWSELDSLLGNDVNYVKCAEKQLPSFSWSGEVPKFKQSEKAHQARYILVVNANFGHNLGTTEGLNKAKTAARDRAKQDTGEDMSTLEVIFVKEIVNTRSFESGGCDPFIDQRSMIRVSLGQLRYNADGSVNGIEANNGIFEDCHNPWYLPEQPSIPSTTTSTTARVTTTTTGPSTTSTTTPGTTSTTARVTTTTQRSSTTTAPPTTSTTVQVTTTLTPKDPFQDINENPQVPTGVIKTGPSADNQTVINQGPTQPVDSPTGCNGPCPTTAPSAPSTTQVGTGGVPITPDSGTGATNTTQPPTTVAPAPAPPVTSSPSVPFDPDSV